MDKFSSTFTSSEELGIPSDDPVFMAHFEHNLMMERRPARKAVSFNRHSILKTAGWALAFAILAYWLEPYAAPYLANLSPLVEGDAEFLGLSSAWWAAVGCAVLSLILSLWPNVVEDLVDIEKVI